MSNKKETYVSNEHGKIIAKDTTYFEKDGSSKTVHQKADMGIFDVHATKIIGETYNKSDGTSKNYKR